jgi:hypothetical protein
MVRHIGDPCSTCAAVALALATGTPALPTSAATGGYSVRRGHRTCWPRRRGDVRLDGAESCPLAQQLAIPARLAIAATTAPLETAMADTEHIGHPRHGSTRVEGAAFIKKWPLLLSPCPCDSWGAGGVLPGTVLAAVIFCAAVLGSLTTHRGHAPVDEKGRRTERERRLYL